MAAKRGIELAHVVGAASEIADRSGFEAVTLAAVAGEIGVRAPSLYSHVDGLPGLRRALALEAADRFGEQLHSALDRAVDPAGDEGLDGIDALRELARTYRTFASAHPGLYAALQTTPSAGEDREVYDAFGRCVAPMAEVLAGLGVAPDDTIAVIRTVRSALHGFVSLEASGGFGLPDDVDRSFETLVSVVLAGIRSFASR